MSVSVAKKKKKKATTEREREKLTHKDTKRVCVTRLKGCVLVAHVHKGPGEDNAGSCWITR